MHATWESRAHAIGKNLIALKKNLRIYSDDPIAIIFTWICLIVIAAVPLFVELPKLDEFVAREMFPHGNGWNFLHGLLVSITTIFSWLIIGIPGAIVTFIGVSLSKNKFLKFIGIPLAVIGVLIMGIAAIYLLKLILGIVGFMRPDLISIS